MKAELIEKIKKVLAKDFYLKYNDESGVYEYDIYADWNDEMPKSRIEEILESKNPMDKFYDIVAGWYLDADDTRIEIIDRVLNVVGCTDENEEFVKDWVFENVCGNIPYDHYLSQEVAVDIVVDTGDENYDFTLNCVYPHYNGRFEDEISDEASLLWLAKQQGYTKGQLVGALKESEYMESKFLKSANEEVANCTSHMAALTFFVKMTLGDLIKFQEKIKADSQNDDKNGYRTIEKRNGTDCVTLCKKTRCGLCDFWSGAGGLLDIVLERDVELPLKYISTALPDGCRGYGIADVYGLMYSFWDKGGVRRENT